MPSQTSYFQTDVLRAAARDGSLGELYWYVEAEFPKRVVPVGVKRRQPAQWPIGCIPVIPAGPDADEQRAWVEMLTALFEGGNVGRGIVFRPTLTSADLLVGLRWYEYGDPVPFEVDHVCGKCGQIGRGPAGSPPRCECYEW